MHEQIYEIRHRLAQPYYRVCVYIDVYVIHIYICISASLYIFINVNMSYLHIFYHNFVQLKVLGSLFFQLSKEASLQAKFSRAQLVRGVRSFLLLWLVVSSLIPW